MEEKIFRAVIEKFEHDVIDDLYANYNLEGILKSNNKVEYYFEKNMSLGQAEDGLRETIEDKYYNDFEFNEFDDWWKFNGDDYEEEFLKKRPNDKDDMLTVAFDDWAAQYGYECWEEFDNFVNLKKYIELTVINDKEDKLEFICEIHYEHDMENVELFKTVKSVFLYESDFDKMSEILKHQFDLDITGRDTFMSTYLPQYEAKIHNIVNKIIS